MGRCLTWLLKDGMAFDWLRLGRETKRKTKNKERNPVSFIPLFFFFRTLLKDEK